MNVRYKSIASKNPASNAAQSKRFSDELPVETYALIHGCRRQRQFVKSQLNCAWYGIEEA